MTGHARRHAALFVAALASLAFLSTGASTASAAELKDPVVVVRRGGAIVGTGFIVSAMGHVMTAAHVVKPENRIYLTLEVVLASDPTKTYAARVLEIREALDVAILQIDGPKDLRAAQFGKSLEFEKALRDGLSKLKDDAPPVKLRFIGHSQLSGADGPFTARYIPAKSFDKYGLVAVDATLEGGNSGGPVFDENGAVVGMVVQGGDAGAAYVLPIHHAAGLLRSLNFETRDGRLVHAPPDVIRILGFESIDEAKRYSRWLAMRGEWYAQVIPTTRQLTTTAVGNVKSEPTLTLTLLYRPSLSIERKPAQKVWARVYPIHKLQTFDLAAAFLDKDHFAVELEVADGPRGAFQFTSSAFWTSLEAHILGNSEQYRAIGSLDGVHIEVRTGTDDDMMIIASVRLSTSLVIRK